MLTMRVMYYITRIIHIWVYFAYIFKPEKTHLALLKTLFLSSYDTQIQSPINPQFLDLSLVLSLRSCSRI